LALKERSVIIVMPDGSCAFQLLGGAGGGGVVTVSVALPVLVSLVAVIVADPAATAVTNPLDETVAIPVLLLDQVTTRPVSTLLLASRVTAVACVV
jgi:hypothetical protein